jgi:3-oxoacyl-[acyl-carrier-protein] synthase I
MEKAVIIEQYALQCALGTLATSTESLLNGTSALRPGPCFDLPVAFAPFNEPRYRQPDVVFPVLKQSIPQLPQQPFFIYAAAKGDVSSLEPHFRKNGHASETSPLLADQANTIAGHLGIFPQRTQVVSNACASGAVAIALAKNLLEYGRCSEVVVAGFDVLSHFVTSGFNALGALSQTGPRPFDRNRDGLSLGDGVALAVLRYAQPRKGDIIIRGTDQSNDANHRTGPSRTGEGLYLAAAGALEDAAISPDRIGAVKCHGTATVYNDAMESKALQRLFDGSPPPCFSLKGGIGHTSGAGSLLELLLAAEFLKRRRIPPTIHFTEPDPDAPLPVSPEIQEFTSPSILCLSAGFGGLNAAIVLSEAT